MSVSRKEGSIAKNVKAEVRIISYFEKLGYSSMPRRCKYVDDEGECCKKQPYYGKNGVRLHCKLHRKIGEEPVNIQNCAYKGCNVLASFGFGIRLYCKKHATKGMVLISGRKCKRKGCKIVPSFGYEKNKGIYCKLHSKEDMKLVTSNPKCKANNTPYSILCPVAGNRIYNGFCTRCFAYLFPDHVKTQSIRKKSKELQIVSFVESKYDGFVHNKPIFFGSDCPSRRRIDLRQLFGNTLLCIEIDENQHKCYSWEDEEKRYGDLMEDFGGKFIFIRFNPDSYLSTKGKRKNPYLSSRLPALEREIDRQIERIENEENSETLEIYEMYFDE